MDNGTNGRYNKILKIESKNVMTTLINVMPSKNHPYFIS